MISKAGIYVIKHLVTEDEYIISVVGTAPMLRVINVLSLKDFARGIEMTNKTVVAQCEAIERDCTNYEYNQLESKYVGMQKTTEDIEESLTETEKILSKFTPEQKQQLQILVASNSKEEAIIFINKVAKLGYSIAEQLYKSVKISNKP